MVPAGGPPPGLPPPHQSDPDALALRRHPAQPSAMLPMPPAPAREDDESFLRRVRLVYLDRVTREHQRLDLLEEDPTAPPTPESALALGVIIPYISASSIAVVGVFLVVMYGLKFSPETELLWIYACIIGVLVYTSLLDMVRVSIITIVELRKFEVRQRARSGELMERRVKKEGEDDLPAMLKPKPKRKFYATPPVPKAAPRYPERPKPAWLTAAGDPRPAPALPGPSATRESSALQAG